MTQVNLKEFLSAYVVEVDEQLELANAKLLEIEAAARRGDAHPRAIRDLFRAVHTIKGLSAMVDVEPAVMISHRAEAILRAADRTAGRLLPEAVDVLLQGIRAIEQRVRELGQGKTPSAAPLALLEALDHLEPAIEHGAEESSVELDLSPDLAAKLAPFELRALVDCLRNGRRALRADFSPSPAKAERGFSINTVRERVSSIAEIVKTIPVSVLPSEDAPGALSFALLLSTSVSDEEIAAAVGIEPSAVRSLSKTALSYTEPPPSTRAELGGDDADDAMPQRRNIVRVNVSKLDDAMEYLSELVVTRSRLARAVADLTASGVNTRQLSEVMRHNARQLRDLRAAILRVRMVPVSEVLDRIPLILRGLRRESGKQVRLRLDAGSAELDKGVAERLFPALVHLVRNAVDHAIELPRERLRLGKLDEGTLRITCQSPSNTRLELSVSDDGAGVDREAVARRLGREIGPTDSALLEALCHAGFSTREHATTTSGRGMGMDIVKRIVVDQLGGELSMQTRAGVGTTFTLRVPLTISIVDTFTLECRAQRFVVPVAMVEEIFEVEHTNVRYGPSFAGGAHPTGMIERRGEAVPLLDLADILRVRNDSSPARHAVLVRRGGVPIAFALDRVLGQQEVVVRPLVDPLVQVRGISGATDLGDGKPTLVLDLVALGFSFGARDGERAA